MCGPLIHAYIRTHTHTESIMWCQTVWEVKERQERHCDHINSRPPKSCLSRPDSLSECVCVCRAAYAPSSDCFQCQISVSSAKANYSKCVCVFVCVFCQSAHHSVFNEQKHAVPCRLAHSHQLSLSLPSFNPLKSFLPFFFFALKLFLSPHPPPPSFLPHPNHSWLNQLQNEVKQLHVAKLLMWNDSD